MSFGCILRLSCCSVGSMLRPENGLFVADFVAMLGLKNVEKRTGLEQKMPSQS